MERSKLKEILKSFSSKETGGRYEVRLAVSGNIVIYERLKFGNYTLENLNKLVNKLEGKTLFIVRKLRKGKNTLDVKVKTFKGVFNNIEKIN